MKKTLCVLAMLIFMIIITSCNGNKKLPLPEYGTYERLNSDGSVSTVVLSEQYVKISNVDFSTAMAFCTFIETGKYVSQKSEEGFIVSAEEKEKYSNGILENLNYQQYENIECQYKIEYSGKDDFNIQFYKDNSKVYALALTYYIEKKEIGFSDSTELFKFSGD